MSQFLRRTLRRLLLLALGVLIALLIAEGAVRLLGEGNKGTIGVLYRNSELVGWEHRSNISMPHETEEFSTEWHLNDAGIRRSGDVPVQTDRSRIVVLGDSHAAGHGVEGPDTFAARLEDRLENHLGDPGSLGVEVLNFAVDGYSSGQQLLWLQENLEVWKPDGVVVGVYIGNDLRENLERRGLGGYDRPLLDPKTLERRPQTPEQARAANRAKSGGLSGFKEFLSEHSKLYSFLGNRIRGGPLHEKLADWELMSEPIPDITRKVVEHVHGAHGQALWQLQGFAAAPGRRATALNLGARTLKRMQRMCEKAGVEFVAVLLPCRMEVEGVSAEVEEAARWLEIEGGAETTMKLLRSDFLAELERVDLRVVDLLETARQRHQSTPSEPLYYAKDWHLNGRGHDFVAEQLFPLVLPCLSDG